MIRTTHGVCFSFWVYGIFGCRGIGRFLGHTTWIQILYRRWRCKPNNIFTALLIRGKEIPKSQGWLSGWNPLTVGGSLILMALSLAPLGSLEEGGWSVTQGGSVLVVLLKLLQSPQAWQQNYRPWGKAYYFVLICRPKSWLLSLMPLQQCRWFLTMLALMETFLFLWMIAGTCCCNCLRFRSCTASGRLIVVLMLLRVWVLLVLMWRFLL